MSPVMINSTETWTHPGPIFPSKNEDIRLSWVSRMWHAGNIVVLQGFCGCYIYVHHWAWPMGLIAYTCVHTHTGTMVPTAVRH